MHQHPRDGYRFLPGGRAGFGETSLDAAARQIGEELHCVPESLTLAGLIEKIFQ